MILCMYICYREEIPVENDVRMKIMIIGTLFASVMRERKMGVGMSISKVDCPKHFGIVPKCQPEECGRLYCAMQK